MDRDFVGAVALILAFSVGMSLMILAVSWAACG